MISSEALVLTLPYPKALGGSLPSRLCFAFPPQQACFHMHSSPLIRISLLGLSPLILGTAGLFEVAPSTENLCNVCAPESSSFPSERKTASGLSIYLGFPGGSESKEYMQFRRPGFHPWGWEDPLEKKWLPIPVFLPGEFHGLRSLDGYVGLVCGVAKSQTHLSNWHFPNLYALSVGDYISQPPSLLGVTENCCLQRPDLGLEARNLPLYSFPFLSFLDETRIPAGSVTCTGPFVALFDN